MLRFGVCVDRSNFALDVCIADIVMDFKFGLVFCIWQIYDLFGSRNTRNQLVMVMHGCGCGCGYGYGCGIACPIPNGDRGMRVY